MANDQQANDQCVLRTHSELGDLVRNEGRGRGEATVRKSIPSEDTQEAAFAPRLSAWLPEAEWEWHDRVSSNLWPCELRSEGRDNPKSPTPPPPHPREVEG